MQPEKDMNNLQDYLDKMRPIVESEMTKLTQEILEGNIQKKDFLAKIQKLSTGK